MALRPEGHGTGTVVPSSPPLLSQEVLPVPVLRMAAELGFGGKPHR